MAQCKCTEAEHCTPECTNLVRFSDFCAECLFHGHNLIQSKAIVKTNVAYKVKA